MLQERAKHHKRTTTFVFKAFSEQGYLMNYDFDTLEGALKERQKLFKLYKKKIKEAVVVWRRLTRRGASDWEFAWSKAGGRSKPTIEMYMSQMTNIFVVTKEERALPNEFKGEALG